MCSVECEVSNIMLLGSIRLKYTPYGTSVLGAPLLYFPCKGKCRLLVMASIHGEEPETTFLLSRALRAFDDNLESTAFVLCANPDGVALGTRGNANGVDLNRNFPTENWSADPVLSRSILEAERDMELSTGSAPASEPEVNAIIKLIEQLRPQAVVAFHSPIGCIDAPEETALVRELQAVFNVPYVKDIGYKTPGSFGTWCKEQNLECVTVELPRLAPELLYERYGKGLTEFLELSHLSKP